MMKLIVLYGPENSGKTTTLKIVYEVLKQFNLLETHWFKYYDDDCKRNDFRDTLVLDKDFYVNVGEMKIENDEWTEYTGNDNNDLDTIFEEKNLQNYDNNTTINFKTTSECHQRKCLKTVGLVLEGDYGESDENRNRDLYAHLKELEFCDVIICACSYPVPEKQSKIVIDSKPVECVKRFIKEYVKLGIHITFSVVRPYKITSGEHYTTYVPKERGTARKILSHLARHLAK